MCVYISHVSNSKHDCCTIYNLLIHIPYLAHGLNNMHYSRLSLSRIPRDSLKYFEISVVRHIRFAELRKKII